MTDSNVHPEGVNRPSPEQRIQSFSEFWPYYLSEHSVPLCRHVHFIGTTGFVAYLAYLTSENYEVGAAFLGALLIGRIGYQLEAKRNAAWSLFAMIILVAWVEPRVLWGVLFAYFWAWCGHFLIEHNRPATFTYPLWSLWGDFRMWGGMLIGRRWTGPERGAQ